MEEVSGDMVVGTGWGWVLVEKKEWIRRKPRKFWNKEMT